MAGQSNNLHSRQRKAHGEDLHNAARAGDLEAVRAICSSNPLSINARDKHSRTPTRSSKGRKLLVVFKFICQEVSLICWRLHLAAWSGQTEVAQYLCEHKADVGAAAVDDMAAIHFASQKGHLQIVQSLLTSGVSVNACTRKGMTALHYAVQGGYVDVAKLLIRKGASLSAETKAGKRPIDLAKNDEVRSVLTICGESLKNRKEKPRSKLPGISESEAMRGIDDSDAKPKHMSMDKDKMEHITKEDEEDVRKRSRETEKEQTVEEIGPQGKKAKVALSHLVDDGTQEDDS